jgi:organic hydroperoxide reductase OsmC/OhrA
MQELPHRYEARAASGPDGDVRVSSGSLPGVLTQPPPEFGGPGDRWSPEALFMASVADCFVLTFRAVARASKLEWRALQCTAEGVLDRDSAGMRFTALQVRAELTIADATKQERALRLLEKAEHGCLITNSIAAPVQLETKVEIAS